MPSETAHMHMDWVQFSILIVTVAGTLGLPTLAGLMWLITKINQLSSSIRELRKEIHEMRIERKRDKGRIRRMVRELDLVRNACGVPKPGAIIKPAPG